MVGRPGGGRVTVGAAERAALRALLRDRYGWVADPVVGPQAVSAGECDVCGQEARMVQPCGPPPVAGVGPDWALGRRCAAALADEVWCEGHRAEGAAVRAALAALPEEADDVARLWWIATGEVRVDPRHLVRRLGLPVGR